MTRYDSTRSLRNRKGSWSRPLVPGAPRSPGDLHACPRVCLYDRYARNAGFTLLRKPQSTDQKAGGSSPSEPAQGLAPIEGDGGGAATRAWSESLPGRPCLLAAESCKLTQAVAPTAREVS